MARSYQKQPSELLAADDPYTAYCFDEACFYIEAKRAGGEKPVYKCHTNSLRDFYERVTASNS